LSTGDDAKLNAKPECDGAVTEKLNVEPPSSLSNKSTHNYQHKVLSFSHSFIHLFVTEAWPVVSNWALAAAADSLILQYYWLIASTVHR